MADRIIYFDCYNGISGDMTLGAIVDLGVPLESLREALAGLGVGGWTLEGAPIKRRGIGATQVTVRLDPNEKQPHRNLHHVVKIIGDAAGLSPWVKEKAITAFTLLARAEAHVHQSSLEQVHFHEVGAVDAIVDVVGAMVGFEMLGAREFYHSPLPLSHGEVKCAHGLMPIPAPATAEILKGAPWYDTQIEGELITPTGAAILRALCGDEWRPASGIAPLRTGYGAGSKEFPGRTNYLRLMLAESAAGQSESAPQSHDQLPHDVQVETVTELACEIDNMTGEVFGHLMDRLLAAGALDVHFHPAQMKKNRPGTALRVLAKPSDAGAIIPVILAESTTLGVRVSQHTRVCLDREAAEVETPLGPVRVKIARMGGAILRVTPEHESLRALAGQSGQTLLQCGNAARAAIERKYFPQ